MVSSILGFFVSCNLSSICSSRILLPFPHFTPKAMVYTPPTRHKRTHVIVQSGRAMKLLRGDGSSWLSMRGYGISAGCAAPQPSPSDRSSQRPSDDHWVCPSGSASGQGLRQATGNGGHDPRSHESRHAAQARPSRMPTDLVRSARMGAKTVLPNSSQDLRCAYVQPAALTRIA